MKLECHIVKDLLPNYIDQLTSNETNEDINEHFSTCDDCAATYAEMHAEIPIEPIDENLRKDNKKQLHYLKKCLRWIITLATIVFLLVVFIIIYATSVKKVFSLLTNKEETIYTSISDYEKLYGWDGRYKEKYIGYNDIYPDTIPDSAEVETFIHAHASIWDDSYLGYLVYTCDEKDYDLEYQRLSEIESSEDALVYSATGFPFELCAVYADEYYGYIYALADEENNRFIYVDIQFCNFFADIVYDKFIPAQYLPYNFNAKEGNQTRLDFEQDR